MIRIALAIIDTHTSMDRKRGCKGNKKLFINNRAKRE